MSQADLFALLLQLFFSLFFIQLLTPIVNKLKMPRVFAEILAGIILGPSLLKHLYPVGYDFLFSSSTNGLSAFHGIQELGLLLLMFCSGLEIQFLAKKKENRTILIAGLLGVLIPFALAYFFFPIFESQSLLGANGNAATLRYFFAVTCAITSIPVISRIFMDLKLIQTVFANFCLSIALIEDLILYLILALTINLNSNQKDVSYLQFFSISKGSLTEIILHSLLTFILIVLCFKIIPMIIMRIKQNQSLKAIFSNYLAFSFMVLLAITIISIFLGVPPFLGAFLAGIVVAQTPLQKSEQIEHIKGFSFATFIPLFFVGIGLKLDLVHSFDLKFFLSFLILSSIIKTAGVVFSGRFSKFNFSDSLNLGVTLNARGGPGIVLASVGLSTQLISPSFFVTLIITALVTSWFAAFWLNLKRKEIIEFKY